MTVNRALLCYFVKYFRAALQGVFVASTRGLQPIDTHHRGSFWLYTGSLALPQEDELFYDVAFKVYLFADMYDSLLLRRVAINAIHESASTGSVPSLGKMALAFENLPPSSLLCQLLLCLHTHHWSPSHGALQLMRQEITSTLHTFLMRVAIRKASASTSTSHPETTASAYCCSHLCQYHEHTMDGELDGGE